MEMLKKLRESHNYTQKYLAEKLKTTQQTIARWESGKVEPSLSALRDLAMIFGTSVDDLLGRNPFSTKVASNRLHFFDKGALQDGFWGNVGLLLPGQKHTKWFPITLDTANSISSSIASVDGDSEWFCASTLNNRMLAINPTKLRRLWLLDEACDGPDDWNLGIDDYEGYPLEFYRGLDAKFSESEEFTASYSRTLQKIITEFVEANKFDEEKMYSFVHYLKIYQVDGSMTSYWAEPERLANTVLDIGAGTLPPMLSLGAFGGDFESYYPTPSLVMLDMPLIDVMDATKKVLEEELA